MSSSTYHSAEGLKPYTIAAEGIKATFIAYGARVTHLFLNDRDGKERDVIVGYDDPEEYVRDTETRRTYFGCMVGPYANRIKKGTFTIDGKQHQVDCNEHDGQNNLHGGKEGYDCRDWTVTEHTDSSITFSLYDKAGTGGFPGAVQNHVTYTLLASPARFVASSTSLSLTQKTPVMPTTHIYWNIGGFLSSTVSDDTLHLPNAKRFVVGDGILVPTGEIRTLSKGEPLDFTTAKKIQDGADAAECGEGATGIDNAFIISDSTSTSYTAGPVQLRWSSPDTSIQMEVKTNQPCVQVYAAAAQDGTVPLKASQKGGKSTGFLEKNGCVVIEPQGWIDGINHAEWGTVVQEQIKGPEDSPYVNWAEYSFTLV